MRTLICLGLIAVSSIGSGGQGGLVGSSSQMSSHDSKYERSLGVSEGSYKRIGLRLSLRPISTIPGYPGLIAYRLGKKIIAQDYSGMTLVIEKVEPVDSH